MQLHIYSHIQSKTVNTKAVVVSSWEVTFKWMNECIVFLFCACMYVFFAKRYPTKAIQIFSKYRFKRLYFAQYISFSLVCLLFFFILFNICMDLIWGSLVFIRLPSFVGCECVCSTAQIFICFGKQTLCGTHQWISNISRISDNSYALCMVLKSIWLYKYAF